MTKHHIDSRISDNIIRRGIDMDIFDFGRTGEEYGMIDCPACGEQADAWRRETIILECTKCTFIGEWEHDFKRNALGGSGSIKLIRAEIREVLTTTIRNQREEAKLDHSSWPSFIRDNIRPLQASANNDGRKFPGLCIKGNNTMMREACPICGESHRDAQQYWIFPTGNYQALCEPCCWVYAPELMFVIRCWQYVYHLRPVPDPNDRMPKHVHEQLERSLCNHGTDVAQRENVDAFTCLNCGHEEGPTEIPF